MDTFYLIVVGILFVLAISDLVVGVSNDAVNFLNSAIGSKVAPRYVIMIIASIGIIVGTTFSSGMMEVARKGIFNPQYFSFAEVMIIFLAVMLTDIILLDLRMPRMDGLEVLEAIGGDGGHGGAGGNGWVHLCDSRICCDDVSSILVV